MVLNPDGSPNPLPIVDVYGTRRGPKQRHSKHSNVDENSLSPGGDVTNSPNANASGMNQIHQLFAQPYLQYYNPLLNPLMYTASGAVLPTVNSQDSNSNSCELPVHLQHQFGKSMMGNNYFNNNNLNNNMNCNEDSNDPQYSHEVSLVLIILFIFYLITLP